MQVNLIIVRQLLTVQRLMASRKVSFMLAVIFAGMCPRKRGEVGVKGAFHAPGNERHRAH